MITTEIEKAEVKGDVAIVDGYAYELERSIPKIGRYLGEANDLIFPEIEATVELAADAKTAVITITAIEEKKGINKIEIWQAGEKLEEFEYNNVREEIIREYTAKQNGKYTIKVYADIMNSKTIEIKGTLTSVKFEPEGNNEWKNKHRAKVIIKDTEDKVINAKYQWTGSVVEPGYETFTESFKSGDIITKSGVTGEYYLWILLETEKGKTNICRSEKFNFDNKGPLVTITKKENEIGEAISITVSAKDEQAGMIENPIFNYYIKKVSDTEYGVAEYTGTENNYTFNGLEKNIDYDIKVTTKDKCNNIGEQKIRNYILYRRANKQ
ncbi:MAG: hypothetical protein HFJ55_07515 [Clostridia bacterium]|jgi:hypothetical protein|nr:hypothetical protein [Clostridia bacterium]